MHASTGVSALVFVDTPAAVTPGSTATFTVSAAASGAVEERFTSLNIPLDLGGDGFGLPSGFTFGSPPLSDSPFTLDGFSFNTATPAAIPGANFDAIVNLNSGGPAILPATQAPVVLFHVNIDIAPSVPVGTIVPLVLRIPSSPVNFFQVKNESATPSITLVNGGAASLSVVPEPSSFLLVGISVAAWCFWRKFHG
jgi:hypothetical protein